MSVLDERPPRPAFGLLKRAAIGAVIIFLLAGASVATGVLLQIKQAVDIFVRNNKPIPHIGGVLAGVSAGGPQTILILGSDHRWALGKKNARSDTMMLVRLDPSAGGTAVMSIPRDLKVDIPEKPPVNFKINQSYTDGGPALAVKTVHKLTGLPINHVVSVNFGGFQRVVNRLGCVYVDVDRRYYHSNAGLPPSLQYAEINIKPGYQRLCGAKALAYVRYRHSDNDFVRVARQQDFLRQAKQQIGVDQLLSSRDDLLRIFGRFTQTDIRSNEAILRLLKLIVESMGNPIVQVHFRATEDNTPQGDFVVASPEQMRQNVRDFLSAGRHAKPKSASSSTGSSTAHHHAHHSAAGLSSYPGLFAAPEPAALQAHELRSNLGFPVYYPTEAAPGAAYVSDPASPRSYLLPDRSHHWHQAYRIVVQAAGFGQYYGIQGTTWTSPPLLKNPDETMRMRGRTYQLYWDGHRLRLVAWRHGDAVYWVSNTLMESLSSKQMLGIARSLTRSDG